jgi:hypothetical protein
MLNSQNKVQILESYLVSSERLISLIDRENYLLADMQIGKLGEIAAEKETLISEVESFKRILISDKAYLNSLSAAQKNTLINTSERLGKTAKKNNDEVSVAMEVNKMVLEAVHFAVSANNGLTQGYSNNGTQNAYSKNATPIKFDEVI